ncbi:MAG: sugar ABC transporter substrate-binding protein [Chlorobi bacterium]|nr:sugar ABC transporter substrate-binding protein [Chlorobiota bacterium]
MKRCLQLLILPAIYILTLVLSGCESKTKIGFLMDNTNLERWKKDKELFEKTAKDLKAVPIVKVANSDPELQYQQALELIDEGVDVIVLIPCDINKAIKIVKVAHANNIPVISYDRLVKNCNVDYYISTDNIYLGELQADYLSKISPVGNFALISGPTTDNNAFLIHLGWMNVLQPLIDKGDIKVVIDKHTDFWLPDESYKIMKNFFKNGGKVDAILCGNDALASGAILALKEFGYDGRVLVAGQDADMNAIRNIVAGTQTITIYKPIESLVYATVEAAKKLAKGEAPSNMNITVNNGKRLVPAILIKNIQPINRHNIEMNIIPKGYLKKTEQ